MYGFNLIDQVKFGFNTCLGIIQTTTQTIQWSLEASSTNLSGLMRGDSMIKMNTLVLVQ